MFYFFPNPTFIPHFSTYLPTHNDLTYDPTFIPHKISKIIISHMNPTIQIKKDVVYFCRCCVLWRLRTNMCESPSNLVMSFCLNSPTPVLKIGVKGCLVIFPDCQVVPTFHECNILSSYMTVVCSTGRLVDIVVKSCYCWCCHCFHEIHCVCNCMSVWMHRKCWQQLIDPLKDIFGWMKWNIKAINNANATNIQIHLLLWPTNVQQHDS